MCSLRCAFFWIYLWDQNIFPWGSEAKSGIFGKKAYIGKKSSFWKNRPEDNFLAQSVNSTKCVVWGVLSSEYIGETRIFFLGALRSNQKILAKKAYKGKNQSFWKIRPEDNVLAQSVNSTKCVVWGVLSSEYICETEIFFLGILRQNSNFWPKKPLKLKIRVFWKIGLKTMS